MAKLARKYDLSANSIMKIAVKLFGYEEINEREYGSNDIGKILNIRLENCWQELSFGGYMKKV